MSASTGLNPLIFWLISRWEGRPRLPGGGMCEYSKVCLVSFAAARIGAEEQAGVEAEHDDRGHHELHGDDRGHEEAEHAQR